MPAVARANARRLVSFARRSDENVWHRLVSRNYGMNSVTEDNVSDHTPEVLIVAPPPMRAPKGPIAPKFLGLSKSASVWQQRTRCDRFATR
jgi:hypothetical protein